MIIIMATTLLVNQLFKHGKVPKIFGTYYCYYEQEDMGSYIPSGSLVVVKEEPINQKDIVLYTTQQKEYRIAVASLITDDPAAGTKKYYLTTATNPVAIEVKSTDIVGICTNLAGRSARLVHDMRYIASGSEQLDVNHLVRQRGRNTRSDITTSGVLADAAKKTMRETIDLIHGAKGAAGNELETVLVTGDDIVNKTLPTILCDEDDVQGNHGASIGSVSPDQLAYLADRGISTADAEALFARAIFDDAAIHAPDELSRAAALARAEEVLGAEIARDVAEGLGLALNSEEDA